MIFFHFLIIFIVHITVRCSHISFPKDPSKNLSGLIFFIIFVKIIIMNYKCPKCGEEKNLHFNYDWSDQTRPVIDVLCNECGEIFDDVNEIYRKIEQSIISWSNDGTKTAGTLTREILEIINNN